MALLVLLTLGALHFLVGKLDPAAVDARRQQRTEEALAEAREALLGYVLRYREANPDGKEFKQVYGYLPMPDLGTSRNVNAGCRNEGCEAANFAGNGANVTVIGRLPWSSLGISALRDGHGECLWYVVSGGHQRIQQASPMNWDTLSHLDIQTADGSAALTALLSDAQAHARPVAIIFAPGPPLAGQERGKSGSDNVDTCGGNYSAQNYLDPASASTLSGTSNYFAAATNQASQASAANALKALIATPVQKQSDNRYWPGKNCPASGAASCETVVNDQGLALTADLIFTRLRKRAAFRADINAMLDRVVPCLRDTIAAASLPGLLAPSASHAEKNVGRIPDSSCYDVNQDPKGYYPHYQDQLFIAACTSGNCLNVSVDDVMETCPAVLLFSGQRKADQSRRTTSQRNAVANYLEDVNLASVTTAGATDFAGPGRFDAVSASQTAHQDIVRCIPGGASFATVASPALDSLGYSQLARYDAASRTLTLGALGVRSNLSVNPPPAHSLYGCAWTPEARRTGGGLRAYFRIKVAERGDGFVFAMIDGDRNSAGVCGAARQHLGYSGNNDPDQASNGNETSAIAHPKIGIEFDRTRSAGFSTAGNPWSTGRNDPDYSPPNDNDAHVGIIYWGGESPIATGVSCNASGSCPYTGTCATFGNCPAMRYCAADNKCYLAPEFDDNAHDRPTPADPDVPTNPAAVDPYPSPPPYPPYGLAPLARLASTSISQRDIHVRVELARARAPEIREVRLVVRDDNLVLSGLPTLDGASVQPGDRILVARSGKPWLNGVYTAAAGDWTRHALEDEVRELFSGNQWIVRQAYKDDGVTAYPYRNTVWRATTTPRHPDDTALALQGMDIAITKLRDPVDVVATSPLVLSGLPAIDGVNLAPGMRVLVTAQTDPARNGVYVASTGNWLRAGTESTSDGLHPATPWVVNAGSHTDSVWLLAASDEFTAELTPLRFIQDSAPYGLLSVVTTRAWAIPQGATDANWLLQLKAISRALSTQTGAGVVRHGPCDATGACPSDQACGGIEADGRYYCHTGIKQLNTNTLTLIHDTALMHDLPQGACDASKRCNGPALLKRGACAADRACPGGQACGADKHCYDALHTCASDDICYGEALRSLRLGFTNGQGTQEQQIDIIDFASTWLP